MRLKLIWTLAILSIVAMSYGQTAKITTAYNYMKVGEFDKAKEAIDAAATHPKSMEKAKTWYYRGKVYLALGSVEDSTNTVDNIGLLEEAAKSFKKAKTLEDKRLDMNALNNDYKLNADALFQMAIDCYNRAEYQEAARGFGLSGDIKMEFEILDTLAYFNAALSADKAEDYEKGLEYYNKIKDTDYKDGAIYVNMSMSYLKMDDIDGALAILNEGRSKYPDNQGILIQQINIYLENDRIDEALENLSSAIEKDPSNASFYFARGTMYDKKGDLPAAEADYLKTIELDPQNTAANYNLGALYVNQSTSIVDEMNALSFNEQEKYDALKEELYGLYRKAVPYLETSYANEPEDKLVQQTLMQLYGKLGETEKYNKLKAIYEKN
ncbi:MAG TPA: hypothetical protein DDX92_04835 [Flavobacteriales bacterium]|mgnify:CR=1 FL=1|jgi:tetratricopeptide (TPR) repeat protein|nr:hypothetical protein [Flavobacteriales bacterium]